MRVRTPTLDHGRSVPGGDGSARSILFLLSLAALTALATWVAMRFVGLQGLMIVSGVLSFGIIFTVVSFRHLIVPVLVWLIFLLGFRNLLMLHTAGLPDISPDRALLVWIASLFFLKLALGEKPRARWHTLDTLLLVHLFYLLASIKLTDSPGMNSWTRSYLMGYGAYFAAKYIIDGRWRLVRIVLAMLLVLNIYYAVVSIAEYFKIHALIWPKMIINHEVYERWPGRSHGVFLQPAVYGIVMGMLLPIQIYFLRLSRNTLIKGLLYASLPLVMVGLYYTYTRGSWLVGIFGLLTLGVVGWRRYLPLVSRLVLFGLIAGAFGLVNVQQDTRFVERMGAENTITGRLNTMARAYRIFLDNPVFGCGYFKYNEVKREYQGTIELPVYGVIRRGHDIDATIHDMYLGILAEEGLVGASLQLAIYLQVFLIFRRKYQLRHRGDPFAANLMPILAGMMVGYLVGGLSIDYRFFTSLLALFYLSAGMIAGYEPEADPATEVATTPDSPLRLVGDPDLPRAG